MEIQYIPLILAAVFTGHLALSDGSALNEVFLVQFHCISQSGNQDTCNGYLDCLFALNDQYIQPYTECMDKVAPKRGVGNCSETEEMYESPGKRIELNDCYRNRTMQPNGNDWTTIPDLDDFRDCVSIIGVNCIVDKCESKKI